MTLFTGSLDYKMGIQGANYWLRRVRGTWWCPFWLLVLLLLFLVISLPLLLFSSCSHC